MKNTAVKIILCLTAVVFTIGCDSLSNNSTAPHQKEFTVTYFLIWEEKTIGVCSENTFIKKYGTVKFYTEKEAKVKINKVKPVTASGSLALEPADFELLPYLISEAVNEVKISLSVSGIEKVKTVAVGEVAEYTFTFLFTRTLDNKTYTLDIKLNVVNLDI